VTVPEKLDEPSPVPDLMAALRESLDAARGKGPAPMRDRGGGDDDLADLTRDELYERAQKEDVPGRSSMSKEELIDALS
jgi:DNA end-binding protein Ku